MVDYACEGRAYSLICKRSHSALSWDNNSSEDGGRGDYVRVCFAQGCRCACVVRFPLWFYGSGDVGSFS